jgi:hypothetical protein
LHFNDFSSKCRPDFAELVLAMLGVAAKLDAAASPSARRGAVPTNWIAGS